MTGGKLTIFRNIFFVLAVAYTLIYITPAKVSACSCAPASVYLENQVNKSNFVGIVEVTSMSETQVVEDDLGKSSNTEVLIRVVKSFYQNEKFNSQSLTQYKVIEHEPRACDYQCNKFISKQVGGNRELASGNNYFVILSEIEGKQTLVTSLPVDSANNIQESLFQFQKGESVQRMIDYFNQSDLITIELRDNSNNTTYAIVVILAVVTAVILSTVTYLIIQRKRKAQAK